jgi:hypothetical protein
MGIENKGFTNSGGIFVNAMDDPTISQALKNGHRLEFYHVPSESVVDFKAMITNFSDNYESSYDSEEVYGRMDPIQTFKSTKRTVSVDFDVVAASLDEAKQNKEKCALLLNMLYPVYSSPDGSGASSLKAPPLFKVLFGNLIMDSASGSKVPGSAAEGGLLGTVSGFNFQPVVEIGFFSEDSGALYPKVVKLQCQLTVQHQHKLGWDSMGQPFRDGFPYGESVGKAQEQQAEAPAPQEPLMSLPEEEDNLLQSVDPRAEQKEAEEEAMMSLPRNMSGGTP